MSTFCMRCGNSLNAEDQFCRVCGAPASALAAPTSVPLMVPAAPAQTSGKAIASLVCGLLFFVPFAFVAAVIFGQALLFGDWGLFAYGAVVWLAFHLFVVGYEEPTLKRSFGAEYEAFCINVPRWIPRPTAWRGGR